MGKSITIGMDMSDRKHTVCVLDVDGDVTDRYEVGNTRESLAKRFGNYEPCVIAMEAGTHSAWVGELLASFGHDVIVANPRALRSIWDSDRKNDAADAEQLARLARADRRLLRPITHRGRKARLDLETIKARDGLIRSRRSLLNHVRGVVKSFGERLPCGTATSIVKRIRTELSTEVLERIEPVLICIESINEQIKTYDKRIATLCRDTYPETARLREINGVGPITALAFVLIIEDASRFRKSRDVAPFLGLVPKQDQSGDSDKQLHITRAGNAMLRRLLVGCSQYILGSFGQDSELRRFGLKLSERGGRNAKKRAVVATARKLAVLMHSLWVHPAVTYMPLHETRRVA